MQGCAKSTSARVVTCVVGLSLSLWAVTDVPAQTETWNLVWSDEFDAGFIDRTNWTFDTGGRWGSELQYYRPENARVEVVEVSGEAASCLVIETRAERYRGHSYTSARLKTEGLHAWAYGRFEARIKIPSGQGMWPAFWILGENITTVGWPECGEIDIMENIGREPNTSHGAVHGPGYTGADSVGGQIELKTPVSDAFHVFALEWEPDEIRWYVDDVGFLTVKPEDIVRGPWVFDHPFFIILNVAVGGDWAGPPDATTEFPQRMYVDYVRVYQTDSPPPPPPPPPQGATMHVDDIAIWVNQTGRRWQGAATVTVVDENGQPVEGAAVVGIWSGLVTGGGTQDTTDASGIAGPMYSTKTGSSGTITFRVTDIVKDGYVYYEGDNVETSASVTN